MSNYLVAIPIVMSSIVLKLDFQPFGAPLILEKNRAFSLELTCTICNDHRDIDLMFARSGLNYSGSA